MFSPIEFCLANIRQEIIHTIEIVLGSINIFSLYSRIM